MISKDFLLIECQNLKSVLQETLGFNYGIDGTAEFYEEIQTRIDFVEQQLGTLAADDIQNLQPYPTQLINISILISRIERSCLGEYSWPFVEEFKKLAIAIWAEDSGLPIASLNKRQTDFAANRGDNIGLEVNGDTTPPMIFVLSEGGLSSYAIATEVKKANANRKRILTIQFPRTLKHFVLLHPILGHELGHALFRVSKYTKPLSVILDTLVSSSSKFSTKDNTRDWLYNNDDAPNLVKINLSILRQKGVAGKDDFFYWANWDSWKEEILCDLIGILMFGPSFLAAHITLLLSIDPSGEKVKPKHPITGCRINIMLAASRLLGYQDVDFGPETKPTADRFWSHMNSNQKNNAWFDLFTDQKIKEALDAIKGVLGTNAIALYPMHTAAIIEPLFETQLTKLVPPVGYSVDATNGPNSFFVDFRHILFAGWLASEHQLPTDKDGETKKMDFEILNRLCEHGIMQQIAINLQ